MTSFVRGTIVVGLALLVWLALDLVLLLFAGVLLAIFLRTLASALARRSGLGVGWSLAIVVLLILGSVALAGWAYAPSLAEQSDQLTQAIPMAVADLSSWLRQYRWGQWLLEQWGVSDGTSAGAALAEQAVSGGGDVVSQVTTAARRFLDFGVAVIVIGFTGLYLAAEPGPYVRGIVRLVPFVHRRRAAEVLYATAHVLRWWLLGQALAMVVVGLAMGIGLGLIGVQLAFILGVLAGLFEFVPFLGPLLALGPALLIALASNTTQAAYVLVLYGIVQTLEGYVLTPLVQRKTVELPPVMTIAAQVALSWAAGPLGLLVAVPLVAVLMVWTQMLYVKDRLGDRVAPEVEEAARDEVRRDESALLRGLLATRA